MSHAAGAMNLNGMRFSGVANRPRECAYVREASTANHRWIRACPRRERARQPFTLFAGKWVTSVILVGPGLRGLLSGAKVFKRRDSVKTHSICPNGQCGERGWRPVLPNSRCVRASVQFQPVLCFTCSSAQTTVHAGR